jgi:hypothetical protein
MTPEGKIKARIKKLLDGYDRVFYFMPVPSGYGMTTIDYFVCMDGIFVGIEAKAPGKKPTARQEGTLADIRAAGGSTFVIDDEQGIVALDTFLRSVIKWGSAA